MTMVIGIPLGILSAVKRDSIFDHAGKFFAVAGIAAPSFWIAIMLIMLFGAILGWLPTFGRGGIDHFILPSLRALVERDGGRPTAGPLQHAGGHGQRIREIRPDQGLVGKDRNIQARAENAVVPVLTFSGLTLAGLLNGSVVVEVIFAWPGIGRLMLQGINHRDFPIVQATVLAAGFFYIVTALLVDILYAYVNPGSGTSRAGLC